jgi:carboxyl-terminal processing protease
MLQPIFVHYPGVEMTTLPHESAVKRTETLTPSTLSTLSAVALLALVMVGCGGGGSSTSPPPTSGLPPSTQFAQQCMVNTGTAQPERQWARSYVDEKYLWYNEVPNLDPVTAASTPQDYFVSLTRDGLPAKKDRFSFTYNTVDWNKLINSGVSAGYGAEWALISRTVPRVLRVAFTEPNSPASKVGLTRGATVLKINNVDINTTLQADINKLNAGIYPSALGVTSTFEILDLGATTSRVIQMTSSEVTSTPVQEVRTGVFGGINFGYILFNDHLASAETQLIAAVNQLKAANIQELVLDMRYNGGGYLYIAQQLGYMIATPAVTGRTFEKLRFNNKRTADNAAAPELFLNVTTSNTPLPQLGLTRVYVLTTGSTCSASESVMNSLRPFVNVIQIGSTTCGKPYGFTAKDNCGTSYFPIEFEGVNDANQGGYGAGFAPGSPFPGCTVADDFDHTLGDGAEKMLGAAITYRLNGTCPLVAFGKESVSPVGGMLLRHPARENKYLQPR